MILNQSDDMPLSDLAKLLDVNGDRLQQKKNMLYQRLGRARRQGNPLGIEYDNRIYIPIRNFKALHVSHSLLQSEETGRISRQFRLPVELAKCLRSFCNQSAITEGALHLYLCLSGKCPFDNLLERMEIYALLENLDWQEVQNRLSRAPQAFEIPLKRQSQQVHLSPSLAQKLSTELAKSDVPTGTQLTDLPGIGPGLANQISVMSNGHNLIELVKSLAEGEITLSGIRTYKRNQLKQYLEEHQNLVIIHSAIDDKNDTISELVSNALYNFFWIFYGGLPCQQ